MKYLRMKALILAFAVIIPSVAFATPAASNNPVYFRAGGGYSMVTNAKVTNLGLDNSAKFKGGYSVHGAVGYRFWDMLRMELEGTYMDNKIDSFKIAGVNVLNSGDFEQVALMGNLVLDVAFYEGLYGYIGGGVGALYSDLTFDVGLGSGSGSDWNFAYQGIAGLGFDISDSIAVTAGYRIIGSTNATYSINGANFHVNSPLSHLFEGGITFRF